MAKKAQTKTPEVPAAPMVIPVTPPVQAAPVAPAVAPVAPVTPAPVTPLPASAPTPITAPAAAPVAPAAAPTPITAPPAAAPAPEATKKQKKMAEPTLASTQKIITKPISTFKIVLDTVGTFKALVQIIKDLVEDLMFIMTDEGLKLSAMDASHVAMLDALFEKEFFSEYKITGPSFFNVNASDFMKILKRGSTKDNIILGYNTGDKLIDDNKVEKHVMTISMKDDKRSRNFKLKNKVVTETFDETVTNATGFVASYLEKVKTNPKRLSFTIDMANLDDVIKDVELISDVILVNGTVDKTVEFIAKGNSGDYGVEFNDKMLKNLIPNECSALYSVEFIKSILPLGTFVEDINISFMDNSPVIFEFKLVKEKKPCGHILYLLAPRVKDEGDDDFFEEDDTAEITEGEGEEGEGEEGEEVENEPEE